MSTIDLTVLSVDDHVLLGRSIARTLPLAIFQADNRFTASAHSVNTAQETHDFLSNYAGDLSNVVVVMDGTLQGITGPQLITDIRSQPYAPSLYVGLTTEDTMVAQFRALTPSVPAVKKPYDPQRVAHAIVTEYKAKFP